MLNLIAERQADDGAIAAAAAQRGCSGSRHRVALLSNPKSTGNINQLPRIRDFCEKHPEIFHYEVEEAEQIGDALASIARVRPCVLVINGGDGTVQAALTELHNGSQFGGALPPVAVLPSGKTNLIALDLGASGDPVEALKRLVALAHDDLSPHLVARELIALRQDGSGDKPVIGMFLGGAGLADVMLYCRNRIYPLGLPNSISHFLTAIAVLLRQLVGLKASFLPPEPAPLSVSVRKGPKLTARFSLLMVTTLDKLLLAGSAGDDQRPRKGALTFIAVEQKSGSLLRAFMASLAGRLGRTPLKGVHVEEVDDISIEGDRSQVILDGETFEAAMGRPILLSPARPLSFVRLAA